MKAEPPPTRGVNRDSGTESANGGWLRRLVRQQYRHTKIKHLKPAAAFSTGTKPTERREP